jgi:hypothetical protein
MGNVIQGEIVPTQAIIPARRKELDVDAKRAAQRARLDKQAAAMRERAARERAKIRRANGKIAGAHRTQRAMIERARKISMDGVLYETLTKDRAGRISKALLDKAEDGDMRAIELVFDRVDGKAAQHVESNSQTRLHVTFERLG